MQDTELREIVAKGEGPHLEFKGSLRCDLTKGGANKELTKVVTQAIAGFLNVNGGTLLIGVSDEGTILGIEHDFETLGNKKNADGFQLALRSALGRHLGVEVSLKVEVSFVAVDGRQVAVIHCDQHPEPVYFKDGDTHTFYVRDGNRKKPLDVKSANNFIKAHFPRPRVESGPEGRHAALDALQRLAQKQVESPGTVQFGDWQTALPSALADISEMAQEVQLAAAKVQDDAGRLLFASREPSPLPHRDDGTLPAWLEVATSRVIGHFLERLKKSNGWKRLYLISPWMSEITDTASIQFEAFLRRLEDDGATAYVVTRPPSNDWHQRVIARFAQTGRANIVYVPNLHAKLYTASTRTGSLALVGSANFTQRSFESREIGILVSDFAGGKRLVKRLNQEAAAMYRTQGRMRIHKARFSM